MLRSMLPFADALQRIIESAPLMASERVELGLGVGRVLAEDLMARAPLPGFDYSAMDGYAVARSSFTGAGPWSLPVHGESRAGALGSAAGRRAAHVEFLRARPSPTAPTRW